MEDNKIEDEKEKKEEKEEKKEKEEKEEKKAKKVKEEDFQKNLVINNKYVILGKLGEGGFGKVYLVKGVEDKQKYALKVLLKEKCSAKNIKSFQREVEILKYLYKWNKDSYILKLYESGEFTTVDDNKRLYYVVDYAEKGDLLHYVKASDIGIGERYGKILFKKILEGIQFCHRLNICHLDIKIGNILLDDKFNPIIIDFGLSRSIMKLPEKTLIEIKGERGTNFMKCPQMLEKDVAYSGIDADIFALGTLLFQLVSNQKGFDKANDLCYKNIKDKNYDLFWTKMILKREDLSKEFKNLYVRMIAYEPKERPSIKEVLNDPWFDEINVLIQYDPEGYKKLENEYKDYMYALELKYKDMIQLEIQNNPNHEQNDGNRGIRGVSSFEGEQYFEEDLIPKKLDKYKNYKYFAKIKGITNPVKFMNLLMDKIIQKNKDECTLKKYDEKLKFKIIFEKEEDADEQENEELEQNEEEDEKNSSEKKCIMDVKIFDCENNEYLLCFNKKQGDSEEFYENFLKIKEIVQNIFN